MNPIGYFIISLPLSLLIACSNTSAPPPVIAIQNEHAHHEGHAHEDETDGHTHNGGVHDHADENNDDHSQLHLTESQIRAAGIEIASVMMTTGGALTLPAIIAADPARSASISASVQGRIQQVPMGLGMPVKAGAVLAVLDSREAAELGAELQAAQQQAELAKANLEREERLFAEQVSPEVDVLAARTAAAEAEIRLQLARQRVGSSGAGANASRLLSIRAPMDGHITARNAQPGAQVDIGDELFQIADLSHLALELALPADRAAEVETGSRIVVSAGSRSADGTLSFLSPVIDPLTRQVPAIAHLANPDGRWRIGETVDVSVPLGDQGRVLAVPQSAVQMVEGQPSVFIRNAEGFKITPIQTGETAGELVTVLSGLSADAQIAVQGSFVLKAEAEKGESDHAH